MNYQKIYNQIIERAQNENREKNKDIYYEAHHIIPKCLGGEGTSKQIYHPNIILLTAREHFLCHMLLVEIYPEENKLKQAIWLMAINKNKKTHNKYKVSSRTYQNIKEKNNLILKQNIPNKKIGHECYKNPERGYKISNSLKGWKQSQEHINKRRISNSKPILQYDKQGNIIREWESITKVAETLNINMRSIQNNCKKRTKTSFGYIWKYK